MYRSQASASSRSGWPFSAGASTAPLSSPDPELLTPEQREKVTAMIPLGRLGEPEDRDATRTGVHWALAAFPLEPRCSA